MTARERTFALLLFEAFGLAALLLTAVGIYGVVSSSVNERVREIGVRTALGASRPAILRMVMGEGASMATIGIALGVLVAAAATQGLTSLLFGVSRFDVAVLWRGRGHAAGRRRDRVLDSRTPGRGDRPRDYSPRGIDSESTEQ